ncbi:MAG: hypothetical protein WCJ37_01135 [Syntrophus sp. (in: bacteria)]
MNEKASVSTVFDIAEGGNPGMVPPRMGDLIHSAGRYSDATSPGEDKSRTFNRTDQG